MEREKVFLYILFSYFYAKKTKSTGWCSPVLRALQNLFIVAGIIGYTAGITYVVAFILFIRNLLGDIRDIEKDNKEGMKTIPILLGMKKSIRYIHLAGIIASSMMWWSLTSLSSVWLIVVILIQISTYNLTPR